MRAYLLRRRASLSGMEKQPEERLAPRKGDVLFSDGFPDWQNNACLNITFGRDYYGYKQGYRLAAIRLVQHVIDTQQDQDFLVYPIVYSCRHHAELVLKSIIGRIPFLTGNALTGSEERRMNGHQLNLLWEVLKQRLPELSAEAGLKNLPAEDLKGLDSYIRQITEVDPRSIAFRYVREQDGGPALPQTLKKFNLRHFAETWEKLADYLDELDSWMAHMEECKHDMESGWS